VLARTRRGGGTAVTVEGGPCAATRRRRIADDGRNLWGIGPLVGAAHSGCYLAR